MTASAAAGLPPPPSAGHCLLHVAERDQHFGDDGGRDRDRFGGATVVLEIGKIRIDRRYGGVEDAQCLPDERFDLGALGGSQTAGVEHVRD